MLSIILLSLLGIGATAFAIDSFNDDDDNANTPSTPGVDNPEEPIDPTPPITELIGNDDPNSLNGTDDGDVMQANGGDDVVRGGDGADTVEGGDGNDRVFGDAGADVITGNAGNDFLRGGADNDLLLDSDGADTLRGDTGNDIIFSTGITDIDALLEAQASGAFDPSVDTIADIPGLDLTQDTDTEGDVVDGGRGTDLLVFGQGDTVSGGDGTDIFVAGTTLAAGSPATITDFVAGEETLVITTPDGLTPVLDFTNVDGNAVVTINGEDAVILQGAGETFALTDIQILELPRATPEGTEADEYIYGTSASEEILGGDGNDSIRGDDGDDTIQGEDGNDRIFGQNGEDVITGNSGNDFMRGGANDDLLLDADGADTLRGDTGDDVLVSTGITDIAALLAAQAAFNPDSDTDPGLTGIAGFDLTQDTDTEADVLDGGIGNDTLIFGQGDIVTGGADTDYFLGGQTLTAGEPATITDFVVNEETIGLTYSGDTAPELTLTTDGSDAVINLDGTPAVRVTGLADTFTLDDVELISLDTPVPVV